MDLPRLALRASLALGAAVLVVAVGFMVVHEAPATTVYAVQDKAGNPLPVPTTTGVQAAVWDHDPVLVFVTTAKELDGVDAARGADSATPAIPVPGHPDLRLFVLSAKSTFLGCTVGWNPALGASKDIADYDHDGQVDGRILDPCGQGQWDAFHRGAPQRGGPAPIRLASLEVTIVDGHLEATRFDGRIDPVGDG